MTAALSGFASRRPLLSLLPFFMIGLALGPRLPAWSGWLSPAAVGLSLFCAVGVWTGGRWTWTCLGLVFVLIGAAATGAIYAPPDHPGHVYNLRDREGLVFGGVVSEQPRAGFGRIRLVVDVDEVLEHGRAARSASGRVYVTVAGAEVAAASGDRVRFPAVLRAMRNFENPGRFDYRGFMAGQRIWAGGFLEDARLLAVIAPYGRSGSTRRWLDRVRAGADRFLSEHLDQPSLGLVRAMLLGNQDRIEPDVVEAFRRLGPVPSAGHIRPACRAGGSGRVRPDPETAVDQPDPGSAFQPETSGGRVDPDSGAWLRRSGRRPAVHHPGGGHGLRFSAGRVDRAPQGPSDRTCACRLGHFDRGAGGDLYRVLSVVLRRGWSDHPAGFRVSRHRPSRSAGTTGPDNERGRVQQFPYRQGLRAWDTFPRQP